MPMFFNVERNGLGCVLPLKLACQAGHATALVRLEHFNVSEVLIVGRLFRDLVEPQQIKDEF